MFQNPIKHEWIRYVKNLLCSSGFSGIWEQQFVQDERKFIKQFEQRSKDIMQNGFNVIRESSRCRMYKEIKQVHKPERYLTININKNLRTVFTKFRLSSHKLLVERGRWKSLKLDYELRKCTLCDSGDIEDEYHVTLICEQFVDIRKKYIKRYYHRRPSMAKFVELMNTNSDQERFRFMIFVNILLKQYENIMEQS